DAGIHRPGGPGRAAGPPHRRSHRARARRRRDQGRRRTAMRTPRQHGQAMVEFMIITPVMLLLVFGALQFAFLYHAKTALNYATFQTAREGAVNNAHMAIMEAAFARNMAAIYTHDDTIDEVKGARDRIRQEIEDGYVYINVMNPTPDMFDTFGIDPDGDGDREIPSDNLMYRPLTREPISGVTVQDANLLKIW